MAERLILTVVRPEHYRSDEVDARLDQLEAQGRFAEARVLMNGEPPRVRVFAGATLAVSETPPPFVVDDLADVALVDSE